MNTIRLVAAHPLSRLIAYYLAMGGVVVLGMRFWPGFAEAVSMNPPVVDASNPLTMDAVAHTTRYALRDLAFSMLGAFFITIPVAWVYMLTKLSTGYDESVVHTVIILPIAVAAIAVLVRDSLPLAFSLAGIVAAVRFRSTLDDTKDAVYVFVAIAVGLAAGVHALPIALLMSVIFNGVILSLWRFHIGNIYLDRRVIQPGGSSGVLGAPTPSSPTLSIGDPKLLAALSAQELGEVASRLAHLEKHIAASSERNGDRFDSVFLVHVTGIEPAQRSIEPILTQETERWRLAEITPGRDATSTMEYLVRMRNDALPGTVLDKLRSAGGPHVAAAEFKSLAGLRKKKKK